jgi:type IV pilus biogenesis protein CpaD/CtpE
MSATFAAIRSLIVSGALRRFVPCLFDGESFTMKYRWLPIAVVIAASLAPIVASAAATEVDVRNTSKSCAWITIYASNPGLPWVIAAPAGALRAGQSHLIKMAVNTIPWTEVKVRAEVKKNADCSGSNIADVEDYRKGLSIHGASSLGARIWDSARGYHITF